MLENGRGYLKIEGSKATRTILYQMKSEIENYQDFDKNKFYVGNHKKWVHQASSTY